MAEPLKFNGRTESFTLDLPPVGRPVLVKCKGFRCFAYRDTQGKWRDYYQNQELPGLIIILSEK